MATKKIYRDDSRYGLGALSFPTLTFTERDEILKQSQPGMTDQERAAVVYFGMLAEVPTPTSSGTYNSLIYEDVENNEPDFKKWPELEEEMKYHALGFISTTQRSLQESYAVNLYHLQQYLVKSGLWNGIEKTLSEESRRRQADRAALDAQAAAAAKALAYGRMTQDEATAVKNRVEQQQAEIDRQLEELKAGILPQEQGQTATTGGSSILPIAAAAAAAFFALKG